MKRLSIGDRLGLISVKRLVLVLTIVVSALPAFAGQTDCPQHFLGGSAPEYTSEKVARKTRQLCNQEYAVGHSGVSRGPLWSAEHLDRNRLEEAKGQPRTNDFRADLRLPANERAELYSFAKSGYDRGHLTPNSDTTMAGRSETYLLSNIVGQDPENNRGIWSDIEGAVRHEVKRAGDLFVITGPLFQGDNIQSLRGGVLIPTALFKCIYEQRRNQGGCYVVSNAPGNNYNIASISEVEQVAGINLFPTLSAAVKGSAMRLPEPVPYKKRKR